MLIVTDSLYIANNFRRVATWRANKWRNASGRPLENSDLWKRFLTVQAKVKVRTDIVWEKGKKSPTLKMVDRAAKEAGKSPQNVTGGSGVVRSLVPKLSTDQLLYTMPAAKTRSFEYTGRE